MKRISHYVITIFLFTASITLIHAQNDIILKIDGSEMIGKVISIDDLNINFTHQNEAIEYKVPKNKISKITFSSGRVEFYNESSNLADHHNKVAILPFAFVKNQNDGSNMMSKKIQQETYSIFNAHKGTDFSGPYDH